ncbi:MAG: hypothetical protein PHE27_02165 [Alphaproteobacteria bacterium]|nr:hypothetical protein [Alphaproteobacteria bacterium]
MRFARLIFCALLSSLSCPAFAATACYSPKQVQAEQLLRLHSEMMVIAVTCRQASDGRSLSRAYTGFTRKNVQLIKSAEDTLVAYYKKQKGDPVDRLDKLRTKLANEYGQKVAEVSAPAFCAQNRDRVYAWAVAPTSDINKRVIKMGLTERTYDKPCKKNMVLAKRKKRK